MIGREVGVRPVLGLRSAVDAIMTLEPAEYSDPGLAAEVLCLRREMDRLEATFSRFALAAHRRGVCAGEGAGSTNAWLGWKAGMRKRDVTAAISAGETVEILERTGRAWAAGEITSGAMRTIADARVEGADEEFKACEPLFLEAACTGDLWTLRRRTAHFRNCAHRDGSAPAPTDGLQAAIVGGRLALNGELRGLNAETVMLALHGFTDPPGNPATAGADTTRALAERQADALVRICRIALDAGVDAKQATLQAAVVIDWETLVAHLSTRVIRRDAGRTGWETGRMDGGFMGPIDPCDIETLLCDCSISRVVTGPTGAPIDVGRSARPFTTAIRRAIIARDQKCRWPGCDKPPGWCEAHHVQYWETGGTSSVANGVLLCSRHHHFLHRHVGNAKRGWRITWDQQHFRVYRPNGRELRPDPGDPHDQYLRADRTLIDA